MAAQSFFCPESRGVALKLGALFLLQFRLVPRAWEALLRATSKGEVLKSTFPKFGGAWRNTFSAGVGSIRLSKNPLLLWGWCRVAIQASICFKGWWSPHDLKAYLPHSAKLGACATILAVAWFVHRVCNFWGERMSRGRAEISDIMGSQSSLREAQVNALKIALQVVTWTISSCMAMVVMGLEVGRILLFPGITALLIGWVGRELVANVISGLVLSLTQPFAQGDWITIDGDDGWVQAISLFYTRIVQWDKRPMYIPNYKVMSVKVQNNSRMTHRRVLFEMPLRMCDIPKIPTIVKDVQEMINEHEDVDTVQHRLVRWRGIGSYSANIWVSCYTKPTVEGIRLRSFTLVQQSVLERCASIVYKHGADFASSNVRYNTGPSPAYVERGSPNFAEKFFDTFTGTGAPAQNTTESREQMEARDKVLVQREQEVKQAERKVEEEREALAERERDLHLMEERVRLLLEEAQSIALEASGPKKEEEQGEEVKGEEVEEHVEAIVDEPHSIEVASDAMEVEHTPAHNAADAEAADEASVGVAAEDASIDPESAPEEDAAHGASSPKPKVKAKQMHDGQVLHDSDAESNRIAVVDMGD